MATKVTHRRIVIAGAGLICPLGQSSWQVFSTLLDGGAIVDRAARLDTNVDPVALVRALGCVSIAQHSMTDPAVVLAEHAAREAMVEAGAKSHELTAVVATSKGAVTALTAAFAAQLDLRARRRMLPGIRPMLPPDAPLAVALGPHHYLDHHLRLRIGLRAERHIVAACASSLTAVHHAREQLLRDDGRPDRTIVITAEAALLPAFVSSYHRLGVLAPLTAEGYRAMPLATNRCGFVLSEVGAAVVLERRDAVEPGDIELIDSTVAAEPHHMIRAPGRMVSLEHVANRLIGRRTIDVLHPHAPGTIENDAAELAAYASVIDGRDGQGTSDIYAVKGALGHGLGAAGLVSLIIACRCAKANRRPPMQWLRHPMQSALPLCSEGRDLATTTTHAVFAAGFAGHIAGAVITKH